MLSPAISALGGIAFLVSAIFIIQDRREAEENIKCKYNLFRAPNVSAKFT
jgi:hypothetical protein